MNTSFPYDAALSFVAEDALTARHLIDRLRDRLAAPTFEPATVHPESIGDDGGEIPPVVLNGSRVIIVLHQRLWGETPSTRQDRHAIERRAAQEGSGFLVVLTLEPDAIVPPCLAKGATCVRLSDDDARDVDAIAAAVRRAGGSMRPPSPAAGVNGDGDGQPYEAPHSAAKEALAAQREMNAVITEIETRIKAVPEPSADVKFRVRRSPDRCVVQVGDVGLSVSWLHGGTNITEGTLLVLEWNGTVTLPGERAEPNRRATVVGEHALHLEAAPSVVRGGPTAWNWWSDGAPLRKYSSRDLAALCVRQLVRRVEMAGDMTAE
jgi:hypothetical protein